MAVGCRCHALSVPCGAPAHRGASRLSGAPPEARSADRTCLKNRSPTFGRRGRRFLVSAAKARPACAVCSRLLAACALPTESPCPRNLSKTAPCLAGTRTRGGAAWTGVGGVWAFWGSFPGAQRSTSTAPQPGWPPQGKVRHADHNRAHCHAVPRLRAERLQLAQLALRTFIHRSLSFPVFLSGEAVRGQHRDTEGSNATAAAPHGKATVYVARLGSLLWAASPGLGKSA